MFGIRTFVEPAPAWLRIAGSATDNQINMEHGLDTFRPETSPPAFSVAHRVVDGRICVVSVEGDLDLASAPELKWTLVELLDKGYAQYVLDLSQLTYMDSMGLGVLVGFRKRVEGSAQLALACLPSTQRKLLEMTGLDACFDHFTTLEEALSNGADSSLPYGTDAAMALGLASTAMPFAASRRSEALRWLRILRLHGEAARVLCALGVGETPLGEAGRSEDARVGGRAQPRPGRCGLGARGPPSPQARRNHGRHGRRPAGCDALLRPRVRSRPRRPRHRPRRSHLAAGRLTPGAPRLRPSGGPTKATPAAVRWESGTRPTGSARAAAPQGSRSPRPRTCAPAQAARPWPAPA